MSNKDLTPSTLTLMILKDLRTNPMGRQYSKAKFTGQLATFLTGMKEKGFISIEMKDRNVHVKIKPEGLAALEEMENAND